MNLRVDLLTVPFAWTCVSACIAAFSACHPSPPSPSRGGMGEGSSPEVRDASGGDDDASPKPTSPREPEDDASTGPADGGAADGGVSPDGGTSPETADGGGSDGSQPDATDDRGADGSSPDATGDRGADGSQPDATDGGGSDGSQPDATDGGGAEGDPVCAIPKAASPEEVGMSTDKLEQALDTAHGWVESEEIVGGVLLVIRHGKIVVHEAFGWADRERDIAMQTDAIFDIASNSKPIAGTAALMLHEEGQLGFEDRASHHLESWDNDESREITTYQLFTHTAGLPRSLDSYESLEDMVDQIGIEGPEVPPGTEYRYSDRGSNSLGRLVEVIADSPVETFLTERIIVPLGLIDTFGILDDGDPRRYRVASKYTGRGRHWTKSWDNTEPSTSIFAPAYGLHSTAFDYGCFLQTMLSGGERGRVRLLEAETVRLATRPHSDYVYSPKEREGRHSYYGLHWFVTIMDYAPDNWDENVHMFGHGGVWGTTAWADRLHDLVFVYFTQSQDTDTLIELRDLVHDARID